MILIENVTYYLAKLEYIRAKIFIQFFLIPVVEGLHKEFARAGSDVLQAFTYSANDRLEKVQSQNIL